MKTARWHVLATLLAERGGIDELDAYPQTGAAAYKLVLDELAHRLIGLGHKVRHVDGGLAVEHHGVTFTRFGNHVMRGQRGGEESWFVPEPDADGATLRELPNPSALLGNELLRAADRRLLVTGMQLPVFGWYLVTIHGFGARARMDRGLLVDWNRRVVSVYLAHELVSVLPRIGGHLLNQVLSSHQRQQLWLLSADARTGPRLADPRGGLGACFAPWVEESP